jgi:hypothetical protein
VTGSIGDLRLPSISAPTRADELWRHSCFEAFVLAPPRAAYYEFNFAPSAQWAAYKFDGYRKGMALESAVDQPRCEAFSDPASYVLRVSVGMEGLANLPHDAPWHLGAATVIEDTAGRISYWALAHPPGKPDFHRADCFTLELAPPGPP